MALNQTNVTVAFRFGCKVDYDKVTHYQIWDIAATSLILRALILRGVILSSLELLSTVTFLLVCFVICFPCSLMLLSFFHVCLFFLFSWALSIASYSGVSVRFLVFTRFRFVHLLTHVKGGISEGDTYPGWLGCKSLTLSEKHACEGGSAEMEGEAMGVSSSAAAAANCISGFGLSDTTGWFKVCIQGKHPCCKGNPCGAKSRRDIPRCHCWRESLIHTSRDLVNAGCFAWVGSHPIIKSPFVIGLKLTINTLVQRLQSMGCCGEELWAKEHSVFLPYSLPSVKYGLVVIKD